MIIGTYSGGSASAYEYSTFEELLSQLPDNTANQIDALNVRNSVYTLWERIEDVEIIASQSASASVYYTNLNPTPITVGGVPSGSTFSNKTMTEMWNMLLYPYVAPLSSLVLVPTYKELGDNNQIVLNWTATKKTNDISSITINGPGGYIYVVPGSPFTTSQSGSKIVNPTQNVVSTFSLTVSDSTSTIISSSYFTWYNPVYWGKTSTFAAPSMTIVTTKPSWADGAGVGTGKSLTSTRNATYNGIYGAGQYLVFAWPTDFGDPTFTVNGLINTAFTKIASGVSHTNMYGYVNPNGYDIWITNTAQNSPITSFVIS